MCKWCRLTAAGENSWIYRIWDVYYPYLWVRPKILLWCLVFYFVVVIISIEYFYLYFSSPLYNQKAKSKSIEIWVNLIHLNGYYILWMINWLRGGSFFFVGGLVGKFFFYMEVNWINFVSILLSGLCGFYLFLFQNFISFDLKLLSWHRFNNLYVSVNSDKNPYLKFLNSYRFVNIKWNIWIAFKTT